jgi:hypothetical protein
VTRRLNPRADVVMLMDEYTEAVKQFERMRRSMEEVGITDKSRIADLIGNEWSLTYWGCFARMFKASWWLTKRGKMTKQEVDSLRDLAIAGLEQR